MDNFRLKEKGKEGTLLSESLGRGKFIGFPDYFPQSLYIFSDFEESVDRHTPEGEGKREAAPEKLYIILISSRSFSKPHPERRDDGESWGDVTHGDMPLERVQFFPTECRHYGRRLESTGFHLKRYDTGKFCQFAKIWRGRVSSS